MHVTNKIDSNTIPIERIKKPFLIDHGNIEYKSLIFTLIATNGYGLRCGGI